jgi:uncharacterized protein (DUF3084 family)
MLRAAITFLIAALLSGFIAFLGNQLGRYIGKRKMTIFGMRPRNTSIFITIVTGMLIAILTLSAFALFSREVRIVLTGINVYKKERDTLLKEVKNLALVVRQGEFVFQVNQPIKVGVVNADGSAADIKEQIKGILADANDAVVFENNQWAKEKKLPLISREQKLVGYFPEEYQETIAKLAQRHGSYVVLLYSSWNAFLGDKVAVHFSYYKNKVVFYPDEVIYSQKIDGKKLSRDEIIVQLLHVIGQIQTVAEKRGMIRDPITGKFGGDLSIKELFAKADEIKSYADVVEVEVLANTEVYTAGPLKVRFRIKPI